MLLRQPSILLLLLSVMNPLFAGGTDLEVPNSVETIVAKTNTNGGVIVHLGCDRPAFVAALRTGPNYLVTALDRDLDVVARCRKELAAGGALGPVSAVVLSGDRLPFRDNSVNLVVASQTLGVGLIEMQRILVPAGAVWFKQDGQWQVVRKKKPSDIDDWTHFLYDSTNNAVSKDRRVGPVNVLQWIDVPRWTRSHDFLSSFAVAVSDNGRLFSILDEAPVASVMIPPRWTLVCRDAFNGVVLWRRKLNDWFDHLHPFRSGPNHLHRRLVATDGKVFVTLGMHSRVSALDALTGQIIREFAGTEDAEEIICRDGCLYLVLNSDPDAGSARYYKTRSRRGPPSVVSTSPKAIVAVNVQTGQTLWHRSDKDTTPVMELTLAADHEHVYYATDQALVCLERSTGVTVWKADVAVELRRPTWSVPTLAVYKDVVLFGDRCRQANWDDADAKKDFLINEGGAVAEVIAFATSDGRRLWKCGTRDGYHFPVEVFAVNDRIWTGSLAYSTGPGLVQARDYRTGEVVFERQPDLTYRKFAAGHHRCHRNKATARFLVTGRSCVEWIDMVTGELSPSVFLRGTCSFGILPANGLLYVPPNPCMCATDRKMTGFCALAQDEVSDVEFQVSAAVLKTGAVYHRLRSPAGSEAGREEVAIADEESGDDDSTRRSSPADDWPTYRHDNRRHGVTNMKLETPLELAWRQELPGQQLTSPTAADGKIVLASVDAHAVYCLDAETGRRRWQFITGGRVDVPPTIHEGRVFFGGRDGCLYAVDLDSGNLVWQLDLVPGASRIHAFGQLESTQPVHGSVLMHGGFLYVITGRSSFLDGGLYLFKIQAGDGEVTATRRLAGKLVGTASQRDARLPDLLTGAGDGFYMRHIKYSYDDLSDVRKIGDHLWSPTGLLDDSWLHRTYWLYGKSFGRSWTLQTTRMPVPAGRLLCVDSRSGIVFGFGRNKYKWSIQPNRWRTGDQYYQVHATPIDAPSDVDSDVDNEQDVRRGTSLARSPLWSTKAEVEGRGMVVTGSHVLIAGPKGKTVFSEAAFQGDEGVSLQVLDKSNGALVQEIPLDAMPNFDSLIAALGRVYVTLKDGTVVCLGPSR